MTSWPHGESRQQDVVALEAQAARAGLACAYANSAEFDAELIAAHRAAGVYRPRPRQWLAALAGVAVGFSVLAFLVL